MRAATTGAWDGTGLAHEAFLYSRDAELAARCLPFVGEGLARGEEVVVVAGRRLRALLDAALGPATAQLATYIDAETFWSGGHATLQAHDVQLRALERTGRPWRLLGEPVWLEHPDGRVWSRFEAVANHCYADLPYYSLCVHDTRRLPAEVLADVVRTHPTVWHGGRPVANAHYQEPERYVRSREPGWTPPPADAVSTQVTSARAARQAVRALVDDARRPRADEIALAVDEVVANALAVSPTAALRAWTEDGVQVWEVADDGPGLADAVAGYVPPSVDAERGRGLWIAWSIADDATVRTSTSGTAVRLHFRAA